MSMNPRQTTEKIRSDYRDYIISILSVKDPDITKLAHDAVKTTEFVKGPYLETTLPFPEENSLMDLASEGLISKEFGKMGGNIHYRDWKLRIHQEEALRKIINEKRNIVVSTGTGSGKTECYLYPILNSLMREKENGTLDSGVRALLIFPMNALANDQQKKLRKLLKDYPSITFGRYTGETEHAKKRETLEEAEARLHEEYDHAHLMETDPDLRHSIQNEIMCREMMAKEPPHILLTNYAMLEYMLLRPDTAPFFDNSSAKNWTFLVIDEAHTYKGANGTEIAFLLRRLKERIRKNMSKSFQCIATSATLGSEEGKEGLAKFAQNLFDEPFDASDVITTKRKMRVLPADARDLSPEEYIRLKEETVDMGEIEKGKVLYSQLYKDRRLFALYDALKNRPKRIEDVAGFVFGDISDENSREQALINLIELSAAAKQGEFDAALLPARYHLFVKSLEGMFVQLFPSKRVFLDRKESIRDGTDNFSVFELANCERCQQEYLIGKTVKTDNGEYFVQTSSLEKPEFYFISENEQQDLSSFDEDDSLEEKDKMTKLDKYRLCLACGRITPYAEKSPTDCCSHAGQSKIVTVYHLKYAGKDNESNCCPCCGSTRKGLIKRFLTANQSATFVIAKSLYDAVPPRPIKQKNDDDLFSDNLFDVDLFSEETESLTRMDELPTEIADESGRKLLIFSDNRQEAAFFAGSFEKRYNRIMWRKVILRCLKEAKDHRLSVDDLILRVRNLADQSTLYAFDRDRGSDMTDDQKRILAAHYVMQEFLDPGIMTGLERLGYIQIEPAPLKLSESALSIAGLKGENLWNLLRYMMDTLRQKGTITYPDEVRATDDFFHPRNQPAYFRMQGSSADRGVYTYGFLPQSKVMNKRLGIMMKFHRDPTISSENNEENARHDLSDVYRLLMELSRRNYITQTSDPSNGTVYCLNHSKWYFKYNDEEDILYRCTNCGKVYGYSIVGFCPEMKCNGKLEAIKAKEVQNAPYYSKLYADTKLIPMVAKEHTAQLTSRTAGEYQKDFESGRINVLSCSTTFEMGVDVGELEATFLRNVPPETSNYIQRAGRAGRRTSSAAFSVTFSRRNSHDMTFFRDPVQIISGKINPPVLEVHNEKIAERHLNSIVIAWFFKKNPKYFIENTKAIIGDDADNMAIAVRKALNDHPKDLLESIHHAIPASICETLHVDEWKFAEELAGQDGSLTRAIIERKEDIDNLRKFAEEARSESEAGIRVKKYGRVLAAEKLIMTLEDVPSISFLSTKGVLPKYGFPVDSVTLDVLSGNAEDAKKIELQRDLKMAIREFSPPSEIVADGKVWRSYAINTVPDKGWPTYVYYECPGCKKIYPPESTVVDVEVDLGKSKKRRCKVCNSLMNPRKFIIPVFGFSTQIGVNPRMVGENRPGTYYSTQTQFWGIDDLTDKQKSEAKETDVIVGGKKINIVYSPGGKLFVLNQGAGGRGIDVCPRCGYAKDPITNTRKKQHETKYRRTCGCRSLQRVSLGHMFSTDILKISFPKHQVQLDMPESTTQKDQNLSVLYAILEGASRALDISRDDINGCITANNEIILFDDTSGGSGFVKNIFDHFQEVVRAARNKVSGACGCTEETSCYGCLRNYTNQFFHDQISRGIAYRYISWLMDENTQEEKEKSLALKPTAIIEDSGEDDVPGSKKSNYRSRSTITMPDSVTQLQELLDNEDLDDGARTDIRNLIQAIGNKRVEHPLTDEKIALPRIDIWPEIFWGESRVALFTEESRSQYEALKAFDWYCYIMNGNLDIARLESHLKGE